MRILMSLAALFIASPSHAQLSVTTFGATDASNCYENARSDFSSDVKPCNDALASPETTRVDRKKTLVNRGIILNRNGRIGEAISDFNAALDIDGGLGEAYLNRGNSHYLGKRYDDALNDYQRSLDLEINKPWAAWYNIGLAYDAKKQPDKAREAYQEALNVNPSFTQAQQKLAGRG
ncbi:MAG: tetratricopeptide repeat protein [Pseudomonadota bacterium]